MNSEEEASATGADSEGSIGPRESAFSFEPPTPRRSAFTEQSVSFDESASPSHRAEGRTVSPATPSSKSTPSTLQETETLKDELLASGAGRTNTSSESRLASPTIPTASRRVLMRRRLMLERFRRQKNMANYFNLFLIAMVVLMLNADQNLIAPSMTEIAEEFNFTSEEKDLFLGGYINIAFFVFGGLAALLAGYAADVYDRRKAFSFIVLIGEIATLCTIFVTDYWGLFVTRLFTGISLGGSYPILFSLMGDTFVDDWRGRAASLLQIVSGAGVLFGQTIAALVAPSFGWRVPFAVIGIPAIAITFIFHYAVPEPKRGMKERVLQQMVDDAVIDESQLESYHETMSMEKFCMLLRSKTVMILIFLALPASLPWGFLLVYAQDFLMNDVGKKIPDGISASESLLVIIIFAISSAIGSIIGGLFTDRLWLKSPPRVAWLAASTTIIGSIPMFFVANSLMPFFMYCVLVIPSGFLVSIAGIAKSAMLLNCTLPETRGTAFALASLTDNVAKGLASFLIAVMVAGLGGRVPAFNVAFGGWILAGFLYAITAFTVGNDLKKKNDELVRAVRETPPVSDSIPSPSQELPEKSEDPEAPQPDRKTGDEHPSQQPEAVVLV